MPNDDPLIALDAMGGDNAPGAIVQGACWAARDLGVRVALVGQRDRIEAELSSNKPRPASITVVHAPDVIAMDEPPAQAARQKKGSSIVTGLRLVKSGEADAFVSAGDTGAGVGGSIIYLRGLPGLERPSLVRLVPLVGRLTAALGVGAQA